MRWRQPTSTARQPSGIATEIYDAIHQNVATKADIAGVRADMQQLKTELEAKIDRVVIRIASLMVVLAGLLFAALQHWPPH